MNPPNIKRISKFLSLVLRHKPEVLGITLDSNGWAPLDELMAKMRKKGFSVDLPTIQYVVDNNNKQRFKLDTDNNRIRANQGHSIDVDVELKEQKPPEFLYHGTAEKNLSAIEASGLKKMNRQHVHLSHEKETANNVGSRYGKPVVLTVLAGKMYAEGFVFFLSENGVWLTDAVPVEYLEAKENN
ncbi:MAG: RNA 2'-phosphotransferase [Bacteroidota bacterium]